MVNIVEIVSLIVAVGALIVSMINLRMTFRANVVLRVHVYTKRTMLEIVNIGTLGAENVQVKFKDEDIKKIADLVQDSTIKKQVMYLSDLWKHRLQLLPGEVKPYILYSQSDRGKFGEEPILLHCMIKYKPFFGIPLKKKVVIDISGTGSATYNVWPTDKENTNLAQCNAHIRINGVVKCEENIFLSYVETINPECKNAGSSNS